MFDLFQTQAKRKEPQSLAGEEWREVEGFPRYLVSNLGRVFSTIRAGRLLKPALTNTGYEYVSLMRSGGAKGEKLLVHRLVAKAFVSGVGEVVNHLDGDKRNNRDANLQWCSYAENNDHARDTGLTGNFGQTHYCAKLTEADVVAIRDRAASGEMHKVIASDFGVAREAVTKIVNRRTWRRVA